MSADGGHVAFTSLASNLVPDDTNGVSDAFVFDTSTSSVIRAGLANDGAQPDGESAANAISSDGRFVAFTSQATNLVTEPTNVGCYVGDPQRACQHVYIRDRLLGTTERVSVSSVGVLANGHSDEASLSADGRFVAFTSFASNLVPADTNGRPDVFVRD